MKNAVLNTAAHAATPEGSRETLVEMLVAGTSQTVERMEARGQALLVVSDVLPTNLGGHEAEYEQLGFVLGEGVQGDPLFRYAQLPPGWARRPTDHSMWSTIVDDEGRERVSVFYKAAFYDRGAHAYLVRRFVEVLLSDEGDRWAVRDSKTGRVVYEPAGDLDRIQRLDACSAWLRDNVPAGTAAEQWARP